MAKQDDEGLVLKWRRFSAAQLNRMPEGLHKTLGVVSFLLILWAVLA